MITIMAIRKDLVELIWDNAYKHLSRAINHSNDELSEEVIKAKLVSGDSILLAIYDGEDMVANAVMEKRTFDTGKSVLHMSLIAGNKMELWATELLGKLKDVAREHDCSEVYGIGREGWERFLKKEGFKRVHTVMSLKV